ncbi:MAG: L-fucose/L-arabinose isomerase family protein [Candidatus Sumerlaeia bacterium]|nr:L-fucose/L-arabinose isomerase family protein [Candidatus Sumerlaeia bacterium]
MSRRTKVGILTFGDGRDFLQKPLEKITENFEATLQKTLEGEGFEVVTGDEVIWRNDLAEKNGRKMTAEGVDCVIFHYAVWAWPQFARVAAQFCPQPIVMYANVNPAYPGLVGMLANAGSLDQVGIKYTKTFGDLDDGKTVGTLRERILGIAALNRLKGQTYALIGGRSLGIDTAVSDPALWMKLFGVDVDHVDQYELVRRAEIERETGGRIDEAISYLEKHVRKIHWTAPDAEMRLTRELLSKQLGMYYATTDLCAEFGYDFCGIKGQRELTEHYATADIAEAFLNDPYGPDGKPHEPIVCSTEADMDAALTMQIFKHTTGDPVLFADIRHYHADLGVWDLCNSGQHATWFAARSSSPEENLAKTEFRPEGFYFPAGGASVFHTAAPGEVTLARLTRSGDTNNYKMVVCHGEFRDFGEEKNDELARLVQDNWPHAYAGLTCSPEDFIAAFNCNHIHGTYGDWRGELKTFCWAAGIECQVI